MKAIIAILSVALVALGGSAIHLWRQLDANRQQVADLKARVDTAAASAPQAPAIAPSPSLPPAEPAATVPTAAPAPDTDRKAMEERLRSAMTAMQSSPEFRAQTKATMIRTISNQYPDVGKVLGLSRDEVDQLFDLLYQQAQPRTPDQTSDAVSVARMQQAAQDELVSLLGSKYAKWEEYKTEAPTRRHVNDLNAALDAAGTPLTEAQNNALIQALVAEERRNSQMPGDRPIPGNYYRFTPEATRNLLNASSAYLTPQQMETYRQVLERASNQETRSRNVMNGLISRDPRILESLRGGQQ
jgi:hypothetical protein